MKTPVWRPEFSALSSPLRLLLLLIVTVVISSRAYGQSSAPTECTQAFYRGDYALAAQLAEAHLRKYPKAVSVRIVLARAELAQGKPRQAFEELRMALEFDPKSIDALYYLSVVSKELSQNEYQRLLAIDPDSFRVHQLLGEAALSAQNPTEAEREFDKALEVNPRSAEVSTELAELKRSQSKFDEAITYYKQAEKNGSPNYDVAYGLGACYTYKQEYSEAIEWLKKAVALGPDAVAGRFALGNALFQDGQFTAAIPELKTALRLEPRMKQAYFLLGRAYSKLGRAEEAGAAIKRLDELNRAEVPEEKRKTTRQAPKSEQLR